MKFEKFILSRFGISLPDNIVLVEKKNKVYACGRALMQIDVKHVQRVGMLAGKLDTLYGIKPSLDFVLTFGHLAVRNFIVQGDDVGNLYSGEGFESDIACDDGLVIIKDSRGGGAAIALKKKMYIIPLIPKGRLIRPIGLFRGGHSKSLYDG